MCVVLAAKPHVVRLSIVKDLPRFDMPLLLGSVLTLKRAATCVSYGDETYLLTTASSVLYASKVRRIIARSKHARKHLHIRKQERRKATHCVEPCDDPAPGTQQ